jgi:hypothetical protein
MSYQPPFEGNWLAATAPSMNWYTPPTVQNAVRFMYAGACVAVITPVFAILTIGNFNAALQQASATPPSAKVLYTFDAFAIGSIIVGGLIDVSLWMWMARKNRAGKNWARILATVFFVINCLQLLGAAELPFSGLTKLVQALSWIAGLGAIVLLWQRDSGAYFRVQSHRY